MLLRRHGAQNYRVILLKCLLSSSVSVTIKFEIQCWIVHLTKGKKPVGLSCHADSTQNINTHCRSEAWKRNPTWELPPPKPIHLLGSVYSTDTLLIQPWLHSWYWRLPVFQNNKLTEAHVSSILLHMETLICPSQRNKMQS